MTKKKKEERKDNAKNTCNCLERNAAQKEQQRCQLYAFCLPNQLHFLTDGETKSKHGSRKNRMQLAENLPRTCTHWLENLQVHGHLQHLAPALADHRVVPKKDGHHNNLNGEGQEVSKIFCIKRVDDNRCNIQY